MFGVCLLVGFELGFVGVVVFVCICVYVGGIVKVGNVV